MAAALGAVLLLVLGAWVSGCSESRESSHREPRESSYRFDCAAEFPPDLGFQDLAQKFGPSYVVPAEIPLGEGESEPGAIVFPEDPERRVEILWKLPNERRSPLSVKIQGASSRWQAPGGLRLGQGLSEVERLNGRPFEIMGFGWDRGGAVPSWSGGALDSSGVCRLRVRFEVVPGSEQDPRFKDVQGDRKFASDDPLIHSLPLRVSEIWLAY